jgi:hypothetical protein
LTWQVNIGVLIGPEKKMPKYIERFFVPPQAANFTILILFLPDFFEL